MDHYLGNTDTMVSEFIRSLSELYPGKYEMMDGASSGGVLLKKGMDTDRVNLIVSNGGGCHPLSTGYVSKGMADASVNGNIRSAPSAYDIYETARHIGSQKGYLLLYNNFMGDYLNNDLAAELLELEQIESRLCPCTDDCLSVPKDAPRSERTGLIGLLYLIKIGAACAEKGLSLDETYRIVAHANERISSVTVTLDFSKEEYYLGSGFSGEPPAITCTEQFDRKSIAASVYDLLVQDLQPQPEEELVLLVSRLDQTRCEEGILFASELCRYAADRHPITQADAGYLTYLLDSHGFFVSVMCIDKITAPYWDGKRIVL
ncbi:MAG: dihydroxyacetone kinase subunit DhaK [Eubacteriales bacterium]|nr:dihydroxyacetone kinase subunit DhaK [Eubacteriales bacterium]